MKVKILVSIAGSNFSYRPGQIVDLDEKEAKRWIKADVAEKAPAKKKAEAKPPAKAPPAKAKK